MSQLITFKTKTNAPLKHQTNEIYALVASIVAF